MRRALLLTFVSLCFLSGCSLAPAPQPTSPPTYLPDQAQAFATQVDAISENLLVAMSNNDETAFLRDMEAKMKEASSGDSFKQLQDVVVAKIGKYVAGSKQMVKVDEAEGYPRIWYDATFEQEAHVQVLVVYDMSTGQPLVTGLWFDSPKLRQ